MFVYATSECRGLRSKRRPELRGLARLFGPVAQPRLTVPLGMSIGGLFLALYNLLHKSEVI